MDALEAEAPPATRGAALAETVQVRLAIVDEGVGLARHLVRLVLSELRTFEDLIDRVVLSWHRQVAHVAGVQDERRSARQAADAIDGLLEGARHVHVRNAFEADVAVADLNEAEVTLAGVAGLRQGARRQDAGAQRPDDAGPSPG